MNNQFSNGLGCASLESTSIELGSSLKNHKGTMCIEKNFHFCYFDIDIIWHDTIGNCSNI